MGDREGTAKPVPGATRAAAPIQAGGQGASALGAPVPLLDVLQGADPPFAAEAQKLGERLARRAADKELLTELAQGHFAGPRYQRFQDELARYGMSVLRGWMYTGYIFQLTAGRGFALNPTDRELEELHRDSDAREDLAIMTVAVALPQFRERALIGGGWRYEGGASLATYFMGSCLYVFPNEFRKRRVQKVKWERQDRSDPDLIAPRTDHLADPSIAALGDMYVSDVLGRADARTAAIVALTIDGYTQEEIAEMLGETSIRAIEGVLYRWRNREQQRIREVGA
jgi:DNA-directed RNA polymerase specialized sigma24 family protein